MRKPDKALFGYPVASTQGRTTAASALTDEHGDEPGVKLKKPRGCEPRERALTIVALQAAAGPRALKRAEATGQPERTRTHLMTEAEKLIREIESLRETIRREWFNIRLDTLTHDDRVVIRDHIERCHADMKILLDRLWNLADEKSN